MNKQKTIAFDLDDVICHRPSGYENLGVDKYSYCQPYNDVIEIINSLYDDGYKILIYTARGMSQFNGNVIEIYSKLYNKTNDQLRNWGVKYHQLIMGKIHYDLLIDDKALNSNCISRKTITEFLE